MIIILAFLTNSFGPCQIAQADEFRLPPPGVMVPLSPQFTPVVLKGVQLDPKNPFRFHFYIDTGNSHLKNMSSPNVLIGDPQQEQLKTESTRLIKYFLASLTIPEKDLWVNLSPYEKDRIVPEEFGQTEMGRDLLAEDYLLKQITASLIYPESQLGKEFWRKVYAQAQAQYGTTNIPINTFNKVWIVPDKAVVYENNGVAFVMENHLKVMLEEDYLSMQKHSPSLVKEGVRGSSEKVNTLGSQIVRQIVIPALTKEVNEGKNFAQLRQVFYSLILATWYKKKIKDSILNKVYSNRKKVQNLSWSDTNLTLSSPNAFVGDPERIYQQYLKAFKKGVFNYIKEEPSFPPPSGEGQGGGRIPRKYFSGGVEVGAFQENLIVKHGKDIHSISDFGQFGEILDAKVDFSLISQWSSQREDHAMPAKKASDKAINNLEGYLNLEELYKYGYADLQFNKRRIVFTFVRGEDFHNNPVFWVTAFEDKHSIGYVHIISDPQHGASFLSSNIFSGNIEELPERLNFISRQASVNEKMLIEGWSPLNGLAVRNEFTKRSRAEENKGLRWGALLFASALEMSRKEGSKKLWIEPTISSASFYVKNFRAQQAQNPLYHDGIKYSLFLDLNEWDGAGLIVHRSNKTVGISLDGMMEAKSDEALNVEMDHELTRVFGRIVTSDTKLGQRIGGYKFKVVLKAGGQVAKVVLRLKSKLNKKACTIESSIELYQGSVRDLFIRSDFPKDDPLVELSKQLFASVLCSLNEVYKESKYSGGKNLALLTLIKASGKSVDFFNDIVDTWRRDDLSPVYVSNAKFMISKTEIGKQMDFLLSWFDWKKIEATARDGAMKTDFTPEQMRYILRQYFMVQKRGDISFGAENPQSEWLGKGDETRVIGYQDAAYRILNSTPRVADIFRMEERNFRSLGGLEVSPRFISNGFFRWDGHTQYVTEVERVFGITLDPAGPALEESKINGIEGLLDFAIDHKIHFRDLKPWNLKYGAIRRVGHTGPNKWYVVDVAASDIKYAGSKLSLIAKYIRLFEEGGESDPRFSWDNLDPRGEIVQFLERKLIGLEKAGEVNTDNSGVRRISVFTQEKDFYHQQSGLSQEVLNHELSREEFDAGWIQQRMMFLNDLFHLDQVRQFMYPSPGRRLYMTMDELIHDALQHSKDGKASVVIDLTPAAKGAIFRAVINQKSADYEQWLRLRKNFKLNVLGEGSRNLRLMNGLAGGLVSVAFFRRNGIQVGLSYERQADGSLKTILLVHVDRASVSQKSDLAMNGEAATYLVAGVVSLVAAIYYKRMQHIAKKLQNPEPVVSDELTRLLSGDDVKALMRSSDMNRAAVAARISDKFTSQFFGAEFNDDPRGSNLFHEIAKTDVIEVEGNDYIGAINHYLRKVIPVEDLHGFNLPPRGQYLIKQGVSNLTQTELMQLNRMRLEIKYPQLCPRVPRIIFFVTQNQFDMYRPITEDLDELLLNFGSEDDLNILRDLVSKYAFGMRSAEDLVRTAKKMSDKYESRIEFNFKRHCFFIATGDEASVPLKHYSMVENIKTALHEGVLAQSSFRDPRSLFGIFRNWQSRGIILRKLSNPLLEKANQIDTVILADGRQMSVKAFLRQGIDPQTLLQFSFIDDFLQTRKIWVVFLKHPFLYDAFVPRATTRFVMTEIRKAIKAGFRGRIFDKGYPDVVNLNKNWQHLGISLNYLHSSEYLLKANPNAALVLAVNPISERDMSVKEFLSQWRIQGASYRFALVTYIDKNTGQRNRVFIAFQDRSMKASSEGGINLNPEGMNIQDKEIGKDFKYNFNAKEIDLAQVTGASFNIRSIMPVTNLPLILGFPLKQQANI